MRGSSKRLKVESSSGAPPPPPASSSGDSTADAFVDPTATAASQPSTSDDSSIRRMLDTVMTIQAADRKSVV